MGWQQPAQPHGRWEQRPPQPQQPGPVQARGRRPRTGKFPQVLVGLATFLILVTIYVILFSQDPHRSSVLLLLVTLGALLALALQMRPVTWTKSSARPSTAGKREVSTIVHRPECERAVQNPSFADVHKVHTAQPTSPASSTRKVERKIEPIAAPTAVVPTAPIPALVGDRLILGDVQLLAASRIGRRHIDNGTMRQDSYVVRNVREGLLAVVADGVGSTRAAWDAADLVGRFMANWSWRLDLRNPDLWQAQAQKCVKALEDTLLRQLGDPRTSNDAGASTMIFVVLQPTEVPNRYRLWWAAVGDSELLVLTGEDSWDPVNEEPHAKYEGTCALPGDAVHVEAGYRDLDMTKQRVLLATDGFAEPFHRDPAASIRDLDLAMEAGDASYLLAAIRQTGQAYRDDATAVLFAGGRG